MPRGLKIAQHADAIKRFWESDMPTKDIAERYDVQSPAICRMAKKLGWAPRQRGHHNGGQTRTGVMLEVIEEAPAAKLPDDADIELLNTLGSWAKLDALREARGWTATQAQLAFHRERLKVPAVEMMS